MNIQDLDVIVKKTIDTRQVLEVTYVRKDDGHTTCRLMEPYDVNAGKRSIIGKLMFWGWCLTHDRIEQKLPENIISIKIIDKIFTPRNFPNPTNYRIPRNWK